MAHEIEIVKDENFQRLLLSDKEMNKKVKAVVRKVLNNATKKIRMDAKGMMPNDPRHAYKAVRATVYRRLLGGNVNILNRKKATNIRVQMSGGERGQSKRTEQLSSYYGADRGFILRFQNAGTTTRVVKGLNGRSGFIGSYDDRNGKRSYRGGLGNRGKLNARNWFADSSQHAMNQAADDFCKEIDKYIEEEFG